MKKRCIISVGVGSWYPRGIDRLLHSMTEVYKDDLNKRTFDTFFWRDNYPPGSPSHDEIPDAFKSYAFQYVMERGYTTILWLDAACWAVSPVEPIFEKIEKDGHLFWLNGWNIGQWCKDSAVETLHMTREGSFALPDITGQHFGVDYTHPRSKAWTDEFIKICQDGKTLPGPFNGLRGVALGEISTDPRVLGHAHEQTVASALVHHHKMQPTAYGDCPYHLVGSVPQANSIILAAGM